MQAGALQALRTLQGKAWHTVRGGFSLNLLCNEMSKESEEAKHLIRSRTVTILEATKSAADYAKQESQRLKKVFSFLADLNLQQMKCLQENQKNSLLHLHSVDGSLPSRTSTNNGNLETNHPEGTSHDAAMMHLVQRKVNSLLALFP